MARRRSASTAAGAARRARCSCAPAGRRSSRGVPRAVFARGYAAGRVPRAQRRKCCASSRAKQGLGARRAPHRQRRDAAALLDEVERLVPRPTMRASGNSFVRDLRLVAPDTLAGGAETAGMLARADSPLRALLARDRATKSRSAAAIDAALRRAARASSTAQPAPARADALALLGSAGHPPHRGRRRGEAQDHAAEQRRAARAARPRARRPSRCTRCSRSWRRRARAWCSPRCASRSARQLATRARAGLHARVDGRYPFARGQPRRDVARRVRAHLRRGGAVDGFFQRHLAPGSIPSTRPWGYRRAEGASAERCAAAVPARAGDPRGVLQSTAAARSACAWSCALLELDPGIEQFALDVDGQVLRFRARRARRRRRCSGRARAARPRQCAGQRAGRGSAGRGYVFEGPWALLRLFDRVRVEPGVVARPRAAGVRRRRPQGALRGAAARRA